MKSSSVGAAGTYSYHLALKFNIELHVLRVGFEVLTAVRTKMAVFWVVAPCSLVEVYQLFRGPCCLHYQGDDDKFLPDYNPEDSHLFYMFESNIHLSYTAE
jgi:hypothetical protein